MNTAANGKSVDVICKLRMQKHCCIAAFDQYNITLDIAPNNFCTHALVPPILRRSVIRSAAGIVANNARALL